MTDPNLVDENPDTDRSIVYYGYVRGTHLKPSMMVHLLGVGDFAMASMSAWPDPLPITSGEASLGQKVSVQFPLIFYVRLF